MPALEKTIRLDLRIDEADRKRIEIVKEHYALSTSAAIRLCLKLLADRILQEKEHAKQVPQSKT
jgi:antitoxin component of RelBE/YafQ-DinJ toxin-antitoxin module